MGSGAVEVIEAELVEHAPHVLLAEDHGAVEALAPYAAEEAFADGVDQRCAHGAANDSSPRSCCNAVELGAELVIAVPDDELRPLTEWHCVA
jgi:hypothetical protein